MSSLARSSLFTSRYPHHVNNSNMANELYPGMSSAESSMPASEYSGYESDSGTIDTEYSSFWGQKLLEVRESATFPLSTAEKPDASPVYSKFEHTFDSPLRSTNSSISLVSLIHSSWAILVAQQLHVSDVAWARPTSDNAGVVPKSVKVDKSLTVARFLQNVHEDSQKTLPFEETALQELTTRDLLHLQTLIHVRDDVSDRRTETASTDGGNLSASHFAMILVFNQSNDQIKIRVQHNIDVIEGSAISALLSKLEFIVQQLNDQKNAATLLGDLRICSPDDYMQIQTWNKTDYEPVRDCVHWKFAERAQLMPHAEAVCAWDRSFTYSELEVATARLAKQLQSLPFPVGPEVTVPVCFPKSAYTVVAMLAVMRAGGAYTSIDPSHPRDRIKEILKQAKATTVITSPTSTSLFNGLVDQTITLTAQTLEEMPIAKNGINSKASPNNACMILFTSGSTGKPKGIVLEHESMCTVFQEHGKATGFREGIRVLQFSAHTFDVCNSEIFEALYNGGTVCIPSDEERMSNLADFVNRNKVEWSFLTPSVARHLNPAEMKSLKYLSLGGEAVPKDVLVKWRDHVQPIITYGPSECSIYTSTIMHTGEKEIGTLGKPHAASWWVVDPQNHNVLSPIGAVGELLIEGPIIGREYIGEPGLSAKAFVGTPTWRKDMAGKGPGLGRFYRSGDLVRYDSDGAVRFVGRKDTQVKLRGLRIELGDIESSLLKAPPGMKEVVSMIIEPQVNGGHKTLAAFVVLKENPSLTLSQSISTKGSLGPDFIQGKQWEEILALIVKHATSSLPPYMVPSLYIPFAKLPLNANSKTDQRSLKEFGAALSLNQIKLLSPGSSQSDAKTTRQPETSAERVLQQLWADVLVLNQDRIGLDDQFFRLGGDSLAAMRLTVLARENNYQITYKDIMQQPQLREMAKRLEMPDDKVKLLDTPEIIEPFSLLQGDVNRQMAHQQAAELTGVAKWQVEDVFPCTPLQEGLMALNSVRGSEYVSQSVFRLRDAVNIGHFRAVWEFVVAKTPILRTRIVDLPGQGLVQVIIDEPLSWIIPTESIDEDRPHQPEMGLGTSLAAFSITKSEKTSAYYFVWTMHHAIYDGHSLETILKLQNQTYQEEVISLSFIPHQPFQNFIHYIQNDDAESSEIFWREQFNRDYDVAIFPPKMDADNTLPSATSTVQRHISGISWSHNGVTAATTIRAAWGSLQALFSDSHDAVFGMISSGRQVAVERIEKIAAPLIATIPVWIAIDENEEVSAFLQRAQKWILETEPYEQYGLQNIRRLSPAAEKACQFQTLLIIQPPKQPSQDSTDLLEICEDGVCVEGFKDEVKTYGLVLTCQLQADGVEINASFDDRMVTESEATRMLVQMEQRIQQFVSEETGSLKVGQLQLASEQDLDQIWDWNAHTHEANNACIHDLVSQRALERPDFMAIEASDGKMTYRELDETSTILARYLTSHHGVTSRTRVALCFEKSIWVPTMALSIMKAGGVTVIMDVAQPLARLQSIVHQVHPNVILCSSAYQELASTVSSIETVVINETTVKAFIEKDDSSMALPTVQPSSLLYIVFTSGSTGAPKGATITHSNFASAFHHQKDFVGFDVNSRLYDVTAYAFDVAWYGMMFTLAAGGCLCIPLDADRYNNTAESITKLNANLMWLTPSALELLDPEQVPTLKKLITGGETPKKETLRLWMKYMEVCQGYGPAECTPLSMYENVTPDVIRPSVGKGYGFNSWIVDQSGLRLVPIGVSGELWLEGPSVGSGYWNEPNKTAEVFIENPAWLLKGSSKISGRKGRCYRTGDIVRYREDGSVEFLGRKDSQAKINGQRIELGEIETQVQSVVDNQNFGFSTRVVAEVCKSTESRKATLVAFVTSSADRMEAEDIDRLSQAIYQFREELKTRLPNAMIPSIYHAMDSFPMTSSGKIDRKKLREIGGTLKPVEARDPNDLDSNEVKRPLKSTEKALRTLWATILKMDPQEIHLNNDFLVLGGDSIQAMRLVATARQQGYILTVSNILGKPRLRDMVAMMVKGDIEEYHDPEPFSVVDTGMQDKQEFLESIAPYLEFPIDKVHDVLPSTDTQALCIEAAMLTPPQGNAIFYIDVPSQVDADVVVQFAHKLWTDVDIFGTVLLRNSNGQLIQVVPKDLPTPLEIYEVGKDETLDTASHPVFDKTLEFSLELGKVFTKFFIFHGNDHPTRFGFRVSHGHFDGVSLDSVMKYLALSIQEKKWPHTARFAGYIAQVQEEQDNFLEHWKKVLDKSQHLPLHDPSKAKKAGDHKIISMTKVIKAPAPRTGFTEANVFLAACSQALGSIHDRSDVTMTLTTSGRSNLPEELQGVVGPCLAQLPLRVKLDAERQFERTLTATQQAQSELMHADMATIKNIYKECATDWPENQRRMAYNVQYQNVGLPSVDLLGNGEITTPGVYPPFLNVWDHCEEVWIIARPKDNDWHIALAGNTFNCTMEYLEKIGQELAIVLENN